MAVNIFKNDRVLALQAWTGLEERLDVISLNAAKDAFAWDVLATPQFFESPLPSDFGRKIQADHKTTYRVVKNPWGQDTIIKLGEVGQGYQILQNYEFLDLFQEAEDCGLMSLSTVGTLLNGRKFFFTCKITEMEPVPGDVYRCYIVGFNTHDGSGAAGLVSTTVRVVCDNTYRAAVNAKDALKLTTKHTKNVKVNLKELTQYIDWVNGGFAATSEQLARLAEITLQSEEQIKKIVRVVFSQKSLDLANFESEIKVERESATVNEILKLYEEGMGVEIYAGKNHGLRLFNAITEYTNHVKGANRQESSTADSRLDSVLFTDGARLNNRAMELISSLG